MSVFIDDPIQELLDREKPSARIVPDPVNGYDRIVLDTDLLDEIGRNYARSVREVDVADMARLNAITGNQKVYDCESDQGEVITIPVGKRIANQQIGWGATAILGKDPYISVHPLDGGSYQIPKAVFTGSVVPGFEQLGPIPEYDMQEISSEEAAALYEKLLQYDFTQLIDFEQLVEDTEFSIHVGECPTWWKIPYDPKVRHSKRRMQQTNAKGRKQFLGVEDTQITDGKTVDIQHVYGLNVTISPGDNDEQKAWWLAERTPITNIDLWEGFKNGTYDLCLAPGEGGKPQPVTDQMIMEILGYAEDLHHNDEIRMAMASPDRIVADNPRKEHDVRTLWFYHPIRTKNGIEIRSLCGTLHMKSERFLNLYCNPYWHGKRPYVPFFEMKRPHQLTGYSTIGNVAPIQRLISNIFHLQLQNQVQQNVKVFPIRENSATWRWMNRPGFQLKPGVLIPFESPDDIAPHQLGGTQVTSMAGEITFLDDTADKLTVSRDYAEIPNRTPAATVAQVDATATVQPASILRSVRRSIGKAVKMYFQTMAQFHAYRTIPFQDPDTKQVISLLIGFPREVIENQFSFRVTATGDEDTREAKQEKTLLNLGQIDKANEAGLKLMDIILDPSVPDEAKEFATFCLLRRERLLGELIENARLDTTKFVVNEQLVLKLRQAATQGQPAPEQQAPPQQPTPPPAPKISISLSGKLTPEQEIAAAAMQGIAGAPPQGAPNAQSPNVPPAGPGGAVSALPAGHQGSPIAQGQPPNTGVAVTSPPINPQQGTAAP
jgi:hypothetical protein